MPACLTSIPNWLAAAIAGCLLAACHPTPRVAGIRFEGHAQFELPDSQLTRFAQHHTFPLYASDSTGAYYVFFQEDEQKLHAWDADSLAYRFTIDLSGYRPEGFRLNASKVLYIGLQGLDSIWLGLPPAGTADFTHQNLLWLTDRRGRHLGRWSLADPRLPPFPSDRDTNRFLFVHLGENNRIALAGGRLALPLVAWGVYIGEADFTAPSKPAGLVFDPRKDTHVPMAQPVPPLPDPAGAGHWPWSYGSPMVVGGPNGRFLLSFAFSDTVYHIDAAGQVVQRLCLASGQVPRVRPLAQAYSYRQQTVARVPEQPCWSHLYYDPWRRQYLRCCQRASPTEAGEQAEAYRYGLCLYDSAGRLLAQDTLPTGWYPWAMAPVPDGVLVVDGSRYAESGTMTVHRVRLQPSEATDRNHPRAAQPRRSSRVQLGDWKTYLRRAGISTADPRLRVLYVPLDRSCASCLDFTLKQLSTLDPNQLANPLKVVWAAPSDAYRRKVLQGHSFSPDLDTLNETDAGRQRVYFGRSNPVWIEFTRRGKPQARTLSPAEIELLPLLISGRLRGQDIE
jgi:hypothetical protein